MEPSPPPASPSPPADPIGQQHSDVPEQAQKQKVPDSLMQKLHDANTRFHDARRRLEQTMDASEYRHQERVNQSEDDLRKAEGEVEQIEKEIQQYLGTKAKS